MMRCKRLSRSTSILASIAAAIALVACQSEPTSTSATDPSPTDSSTDSIAAQQLRAQAAVRVVAEGCKTNASLGAGAVIADDRIVTVAHVVAGATTITLVAFDGTRYSAELVGIDRVHDLALLRAAVPLVALPSRAMVPGDAGWYTVYRQDAAVEMPFEAQAVVDINVNDIDNTAKSLRRGFQVQATVKSGDSGAVLVVDGAATAVLFARSTGADERAWATDLSELQPLLGQDTGQAVDRGRCVGVAD